MAILIFIRGEVNICLLSMPPTRKETTIEERSIVVREFSKGRSYQDISQIVGRPVTTVKSIIKRYGEQGFVANNPRSGRPTALSPREIRFFVKRADQNPRDSAPKLNDSLLRHTGATVSDVTIRRTLNKAGLHGRTARNKPFINKTNKKKRLQFAKDNVDKGQEYWNDVLFTDESKFNIHASDVKVRVWRRVGEALKEKNLKGTVKHGGGGVMVWGCMAANGVGSLCFIDGIMNHRKYIDILTAELIPSVTKLGIRDTYIFSQDNDPKHTAWNTRQWLLYNTRRQIKTPPQSPDINPIEHLWAEVERQLRNRTIRNIVELRTAIRDIWENIEEEKTRTLVGSMKRRMQAVIDAKGGPTKY